MAGHAQSQQAKGLSRRQKEIKKIRIELRSLKRRWKMAKWRGDELVKAGLEELWNQQRDKLKKLKKAERLRRKRKLKECQRRKFFDNPHVVTKAIFATAKSGELLV